MKRNILVLILLLGCFVSQAQIGVGVPNPAASAAFEVRSTTKGLLPPRLTTGERDAIASPATGLTIYNTTKNCLEWYTGSVWYNGCGNQDPGLIASLICSGAISTGALANGLTAIGVSSSIAYAGGNGGPYTSQSVTSTGVTGLTATLLAGNFAVGSGTLAFSLTGTPAGSGTASFAIAIGGQTCTLSVAVPVGSIASLACSGATTTGTLANGLAASGVSFSIAYTGGNGGLYTGQTVTSTGVTGLTATLVAGNFAVGSRSLDYSLTGTPASSGTASFAIGIGGQTCTLSVDVAFVAPVYAIGTGLLSGKTCFDIAYGNDALQDAGTLSGRTANKADFTLPAFNQQTYTFTPSGTVSNVRFAYVNTNGTVITALTGGNSGNNITTAQAATVTYSTALNIAARGLLTSNALSASIYVMYNNNATNTGTDMQLKLITNVKDAQCCGAYIATDVYKTFMCHNLGATDTSLDPNVPVQGIHGNYYQWGKNTAVANDRTPPWIGTWNLTRAADDSWSDTSRTANDPCPDGFKVPTKAQWNNVLSFNTKTRTGSWTDDGNFTTAIHFGPNASAKTLTLPTAGNRNYLNGELLGRGNYGTYWSSTMVSSGGNVHYLLFGSSYAYIWGGDSRNGFSVRCVSE